MTDKYTHEVMGRSFAFVKDENGLPREATAEELEALSAIMRPFLKDSIRWRNFPRYKLDAPYPGESDET